MVAAVAASITASAPLEDRVLLKEVGGHWVNLKDIHNSAAAYKAANPDYRRLRAPEALAEQDKRTTMELLEGPESQQARQRAIAKEQWLQKKSLELDLREAKKTQAKADYQLRKGQWKPPGSRKRRRNGEGASDDNSEGHVDALYVWDDANIIS